MSVLSTLRSQDYKQFVAVFTREVSKRESSLVIGVTFLLCGGMLLFIALPIHWKISFIFFVAGAGVAMGNVYCWAEGVITKTGFVGFLPIKIRISLLDFLHKSPLVLMENSRSNNAKMGEIVASVILPLSSKERREADRILDPEIVSILHKPLAQFLPPSVQILMFPQKTSPQFPSLYSENRELSEKRNVSYQSEEDDEKQSVVECNPQPTTSLLHSSPSTPLPICSKAPSILSASPSKSPRGESTADFSENLRKGVRTLVKKLRNRAITLRTRSNIDKKKSINLFGVTFAKKPIFGYLMDSKMAEQSITLVKYLIQRQFVYVSNWHLRILQIVSLLFLAISLWRRRWARRMVFTGAKVGTFVGIAVTALLSTGVIQLRAGK